MIRIQRHSGIYALEAEQFLPISLEHAWEFFSSPRNLQKITPKHMGFQITSEDETKMYPGQIISYRVGILPMIKSNWVTEITHVRDKSFFVDEQRFGPYSMWHHEHHFEAVEGGVMMRDKVSYKVPFGPLGRLVHRLLIRSQLKNIFKYRFKILEETFVK